MIRNLYHRMVLPPLGTPRGTSEQPGRVSRLVAEAVAGGRAVKA